MTLAARTATRGAARRREILDGLVDLFLAEGFTHLNVEDLALRLQCSKSTLYSVAPSKEQLVAAVVREFFRQATEHVDARTAAVTEPIARIGAYLEAISDELAPASSQFFAHLDAFAPAREIYAHNTAIAARRVRELVTAATAPRSGVDAGFLGAVTGSVMGAIQRGEVAASTSLSDATAYRLLADLIVAGAAGVAGASAGRRA